MFYDNAVAVATTRTSVPSGQAGGGLYDTEGSVAKQIAISKGEPGPIGPRGPSGIIVLDANQAVPSGTLAGTVIFRRL